MKNILTILFNSIEGGCYVYIPGLHCMYAEIILQNKETTMTNKVTERAMEFFWHDEDASKMLNELLESGKPCRIIAEALQEYMNQLNRFELMGIYHALQVHVIDATDWDEVANRALCDWYGAHSDNNC